MTDAPSCPSCRSPYAYADGARWSCPECGHEWDASEATADTETVRVVKDAVGNVLQDGDSVTLIKDLKVKGASGALKAGTKVRGIRLVDGHDGHDIDCRIDGYGAMQLKSSVVRKA